MTTRKSETIRGATARRAVRRLLLAGLAAGLAAACAAAQDARPPARRPAFMLRGTTFVCYGVDAGEQVSLRLATDPRQTAPGALPAYEVIDARSRHAVPTTPFRESVEIRYATAGSGLNCLVIVSGRHWVAPDAGTRDAILSAGPSRPLHYRGRGIPLYFMTSPDSGSVRLHVTCPDQREGATFRIFDADGEPVFEKTDPFTSGERIRVSVPSRQRGRVWSFRADDPRALGFDYACDDVVVAIEPPLTPFVAATPEALAAVLRLAGDQDAAVKPAP